MVQATNTSHSNADIDLILTDFGEFLNSEQQSVMAMKYLQLANRKNPRVASLSHRIFV